MHEKNRVSLLSVSDSRQRVRDFLAAGGYTRFPVHEFDLASSDALQVASHQSSDAFRINFKKWGEDLRKLDGLFRRMFSEWEDHSFMMSWNVFQLTVISELIFKGRDKFSSRFIADCCRYSPYGTFLLCHSHETKVKQGIRVLAKNKAIRKQLRQLGYY